MAKSIKPVTGIKGMDVVMSNLNREILAMKGRSMAGLIEASILIRRDMDKTPPLIPVDTGNLRGSWFTTPFKKVVAIGLKLGFSANYAVFVHEMLGPGKPGFRYGPGKGRKRWYEPRPGGGPKFFEAALNRNHKQVLHIIAKNASIKR